MKYKPLGNSPISISMIGMGCWPIGGKWGSTDDKESIKAIKKALGLGVNFFDTADVYGLGHSEELLGQVLGSNSNAIIATKVGLRWNKKGKIHHDLSTTYIKEACEKSLKRLNREQIDLYQIHWPDPNTDFSQTLQALDDLVKEGKVKYVGACNLSLKLLKKISTYPWFVSYQDLFNLFEQGAKKELLPYCQKNNIAFIGYEPLFKGMLTGKFKEQPRFDKGDHRKYESRFNGQFAFYKSKVDYLSSVAKENNLTTTQLALALLFKNDGLTAIIPGAKTAKQVEENILAVNIDEKLLKMLDNKVSEVFIKHLPLP